MGKKSAKKIGIILLYQMFTLPPLGGKVTLPPSKKGEQEIFRDVKGWNWIQNGMKLFFRNGLPKHVLDLGSRSRLASAFSGAASADFVVFRPALNQNCHVNLIYYYVRN